MTDNPSAKRKNDEKRNGLPRRWMIVIGALILATIITALGLILRVQSLRTQPTGFLYYGVSEDRNILDYKLNLETGERTRLPPNTMFREPITWPAVSPDGQWSADWLDNAPRGIGMTLIFFHSTVGEKSFSAGIFQDYDSTINWSPTSEQAVISAIKDPGEASRSSNLWEISMNGDVKRLTDDSINPREPAYSPDGASIAYIGSLNFESRLYVLDRATGESRMLAPDMDASTLSWSPDGQWIAFAGQGDIWIVRRDGTDLQIVASTFEREHSPLWHP